jgi:hypothetical protein
VFRIGRKPDPWALLSWTWAHDDGTFGNRYDDPKAKYRVLYAATERFGCFVETLARYRIDPLLAAEMAEIAGDDDFYPIGKVPPEWFDNRVVGGALVHAECADIYRAEWIDRLRIKFLPHLAEFGISDLDASILHASSPRKLTQVISRIVYEDRLNGIKYRSKFGYDIENWAFFEPVTLLAKVTEDLKLDDVDLSRALQLHHLVVGD